MASPGWKIDRYHSLSRTRRPSDAIATPQLPIGSSAIGAVDDSDHPCRDRASVGHRSTQSAHRMHRSSWMINALAGPVGAGSTPVMSSIGMMRMHFSGQMSTHPPHKMQIY